MKKPNTKTQAAPQTQATVQTPPVADTATTTKAAAPKYVKGRFADTGVITLKVTGNPKRPTGKSHKRFDLYKPGQTVAEYVQAVVASGLPGATKRLAHDDLRWDAAHGFIEVNAPSA